jgi:hypothetical protein
MIPALLVLGASPAGAAARTRTVRLPRDISATADWCVIEAARDGGAVAAVDFGLGHNPDE